MADSLDSASGHLADGNAIEVTGRIMVVTIIILLFVVIFVFCLHLYAKWYWSRLPGGAAAATGRRRRRQEVTVISSSGLNASALEAIPVVLFDPKQFKNGLECAVCLSEVSEGEKTRLLPKCNHGFHVECIDMWFHSHSTCPICRNPVADQKSNSDADTPVEGILQTPVGDSSSEAPNLPTNVLFWGDETRVSTLGPCAEESRQGGESSCSSSSSSSSTAVAVSTSNRPDGALVIDIPRQGNEEEEQKSPIPSALRSLRRLLSGNSRRVNPSSPRNQDIERGVRSQT